MIIKILIIELILKEILGYIFLVFRLKRLFQIISFYYNKNINFIYKFFLLINLISLRLTMKSLLIIEKNSRY